MAALLVKNSALDELCTWEDLTKYDWLFLLEHRTDLADKCPWSMFDGHRLGRDDVYYLKLLEEHPQYAGKCDLSVFYAEDTDSPFSKEFSIWYYYESAWYSLLLKHPEFVQDCPMCSELESDSWARLISEHPSLADYCPWEKLKDASLSELEIVIEEQPELLKHVPWESVKRDVWASILQNYPLLARRPMNCQLAVDLFEPRKMR